MAWIVAYCIALTAAFIYLYDLHKREHEYIKVTVKKLNDRYCSMFDYVEQIKRDTEDEFDALREFIHDNAYGEPKELGEDDLDFDRRLSDGLNSIMSYDINAARKGAKDN